MIVSSVDSSRGLSGEMRDLDEKLALFQASKRGRPERIGRIPCPGKRWQRKSTVSRAAAALPDHPEGLFPAPQREDRLLSEKRGL
jgi:hypothetical protein